jgi:hypothetical protein
MGRTFVAVSPIAAGPAFGDARARPDLAAKLMMLGLFAAGPFAKGEPIAIYRGKRTTQRPYGAYALEMSDGTAIDATESKCSARYANFARTRSQTNAAFVERGNRGILVATRPIVPGEEIAVWNGRARRVPTKRAHRGRIRRQPRVLRRANEANGKKEHTG